MDYLDEALLLKDNFINVLRKLELTKEVRDSDKQDLYRYTGEIAYIYGHAYLDQYNDDKLATISTINELISALTYSSFDLFDAVSILPRATLRQIQEIKKALSEIEETGHLDDEDILTIEEIRTHCLEALEEGDIKKYNKELYGLITYGEERNNDLLKNYALGDNDSENEDYEYNLYEGSKDASETLEYYTTLYDQLYINDETNYNKETLKNLLNSLQ